MLLAQGSGPPYPRTGGHALRAGVVVAIGALVLLWVALARSQPPVEDQAPPDQSVEVNETIDKEVDVKGPVQLEFQDLRGSVTIKTGKPGKILIQAVKRAGGANTEEAQRALQDVSSWMKQEPGKIILSTKVDTGRWPFTRSAAGKYVDYQLTVQEDSGAIVTNAVGSVDITGLKDGVSVTGRKVDVVLTDINGGVNVQVAQGQISVEGGGGGVALSTQQGTITAEKLGGKALTVSGDQNISVLDATIGGDVSVRTQNGDIQILRLHGKSITSSVVKGSTEVQDTTADGVLSATAKQGGLYFTRTNAGTLKAATDSGKIELSEVQGAMDLSTKSGGVSLWRATPKTLRVDATAAVYFSGQLPGPGQYTMRTSSGDIVVYISKESSLKLDASSTDGVSVDPNITVRGGNTADKHLQGTINAGAAPLTLSTGSGSIKILTGEPMVFPD